MTVYQSCFAALTAATLFLFGCQVADDPAAASSAPASSMDSAVDGARLTQILGRQASEVQARFGARHPRETLEFFGVAPGMTVVEALPGGGWYTKILAPYLGADGIVVGADYDRELYPLFGFMSAEQLAAKDSWVADWTAEARAWFDGDAATIDAFQFGSLPARLDGQADAVLFIRALHNLARFESRGGFLTEALAESYRVLKPGGIVGVVQHMAPEDAPDAWADGSAGYLKKSHVIAMLESAGFEFVAESPVNVNPKDQPTPEDIVWRLPPTLALSRDNPEQAAKFREIGESTRMTPRFRKPE